MRVTLTQAVPYAADGIHVGVLRSGETHDLAPALAAGLLEIGAAIPFHEPAKQAPRSQASKRKRTAAEETPAHELQHEHLS